MNQRTVAFASSATALGIFIAWADARPGWDDAGITAVALLVVSAAFGGLRPRQAWLAGIAVGLWIPAYGILRSHNFGSILALVIAMIGAYAAAGARLALTDLPV